MRRLDRPRPRDPGRLPRRPDDRRAQRRSRRAPGRSSRAVSTGTGCGTSATATTSCRCWPTACRRPPDAAVPTDWLERATRRRHVTLLTQRPDGRGARAGPRRLRGGRGPGDPGQGPRRGRDGCTAAWQPAAPPTSTCSSARPTWPPAGRSWPSSATGSGELTFIALAHEFHDPPYYVGDRQPRPSGSSSIATCGPTGSSGRTSTACGRGSAEGTLLGRPAPPAQLRGHAPPPRDPPEPIRRSGCAGCATSPSSSDDAATSSTGTRSLERAERVGARTATWMVLSLAERFLGAEPPAGTLERFRVGSGEAGAPRADLRRRRHVPGGAARRHRPDASPHPAGVRAGRRRPDRPGARLEPPPLDPPDPPPDRASAGSARAPPDTV